jgi:hypothetical protein
VLLVYALQGTPVLEFEPPLKLDEDYTVVSAEPEQLSLKLIEGKKWRATGGLLTLKTIKIDADVIKLGGDAGIQVQYMPHHRTHVSKLLVVLSMYVPDARETAWQAFAGLNYRDLYSVVQQQVQCNALW